MLKPSLPKIGRLSGSRHSSTASSRFRRSRKLGYARSVVRSRPPLNEGCAGAPPRNHREPVIGRQSQDDGSLGEEPIQGVHHSPDLDVDPPERVQVLLRLHAVAMGDHVLGGEGQPHEVRLPATAESEGFVLQEGQREVRQELVGEGAVAERREVASRIDGQRVVPAQAVRRELVVEHARRRYGLWQRLRRDGLGCGQLLPHQAEAREPAAVSHDRARGRGRRRGRRPRPGRTSRRRVARCGPP